MKKHHFLSKYRRCFAGKYCDNGNHTHDYPLLYIYLINVLLYMLSLGRYAWKIL